MNQNPLQPQNRSSIRELAQYLRLLARLLRDPRVNPLLKLLPIGALAYLVWPLDLAPGMALPVIGALDDAAILWVGINLFIELSPPEVVIEHKRALGLLPPADPASGEVIDGEVHDPDED